ncbi:unnamed protein product, partial [Onchocerca flexuosa]|uniref:Transcription termination factor Rho n=1 Tax=Onchocerca flexuosa TaxID=387005 RepID=A0A183HGL3_9BILA
IVEEKRVRGSGRRRKDREGDEFVNDDSDLGDWNAGEGGELRKKKEKRGRKKRERREMSSGGSGGEVDEAEGRNRRKSKKIRFERNDFELSAKQKMKVKSREFVQSDESSSDENVNKPSKSQLSGDSDVTGSPEPEPPKITRSDSSAAEDAGGQTDSDDSDNGQPKTKRHITNSSEQSSSESSVEDRARSPSDSDDGEVEKTSVKATKRKRIVSSDEEGSENNRVIENNADFGENDIDEDAGFAIADDD